MTTDELAATGLENLRRKRRGRLLTAMEAADEAYRIPSYTIPRWQPFEDPEEGKEFDLFNGEDEKEQLEPTPPCPRYDEIKNYILYNSSQGRLCFDTMTDIFPEPTLYKYIQKYGDLDITPQELSIFLKNCSDRREVFW
jgi:hypothetical protein